MDKVVYDDGNKAKVLKGKLLASEENFIVLEMENSVYKINKSKVISIRTE